MQCCCLLVFFLLHFFCLLSRSTFTFIFQHPSSRRSPSADRNNDMHFSRSKIVRQFQKEEVNLLEQINHWRKWKDEEAEVEKAWRIGTGGAFIWL